MIKKEGIVTEYNGYEGYLVDKDGNNYIILQKDMIDINELKKGDVVTFVPDIYNGEDHDYLIARFIKNKEEEYQKNRYM